MSPIRLHPPAHRAPVRCAARGFTLVEFLAVVTIAGILSLVAVPSLRATMQKNRLDTASNQFVATLAMARSEAVKQGAVINVTSMAGGLDWSGGWKVVGVPGQANATAQVGGTLSAPMTGFGNVPALGFDPRGRLLINGLANNGAANFIFCADGVDATKSRGVNVSATGRMRIADTNAASSLPYEEGQQSTMQACDAP